MPGVTAPPSRKRGGRPTILTDELTAKIVKHIVDEAAFFEMACVLEGIPAFTGRDWLLRGKRARRDGKDHLASEALYARFSSAVEVARASLKAKFTAGILVHGKKDWKAIAWVAKAMFPQEFGTQPTAVVVDTEERQLEDGTVEQTTTIAVQRPAGGDDGLTDDDYADAAAFLLKRKRLRQAQARQGGASENG